MKKYLLGVDNGGTYIKSAIFDENGRQYFVEKLLSKAEEDGKGISERKQDALWENNCKCIRSLIEKSGILPEEIAGVAFAGQGKGLYAVDAAGQDIRAAITSADMRASEVVQRLHQAGVDDRLFPKTYQSIHTYHPLAILRWMKENEPENYHRIRWIFAMKDYLNYRMTGNAASDYSSQSGSPFVSFAGMKYDREILEAVGIGECWEKLPELKWPGERCGTVSESAHQKTGLAVGTPVSIGMFDVNSCALAMGVLKENIMFMITGTWSINAYIANKPTLDNPASLNSVYFVPGYYQIEQGSPTSAGVLEWAIPLLYPDMAEKRGGIYDRINADVAQVDPKDSNLLFLPFVYGTPNSDKICGAWIGLNVSTRREEMVAAIYEGVAFGHRYHVEQLKRGHSKPFAYRLAGGVVNSEVWTQIFADVLNQPVEVLRGRELGAQGAALSAGIAAGIYPDFENAVTQCIRIDQELWPNPERAAIYEKKYQQYKRYADMILKDHG